MDLNNCPLKNLNSIPKIQNYQKIPIYYQSNPKNTVHIKTLTNFLIKLLMNRKIRNQIHPLKIFNRNTINHNEKILVNFSKWTSLKKKVTIGMKQQKLWKNQETKNYPISQCLQ